VWTHRQGARNETGDIPAILSVSGRTFYSCLWGGFARLHERVSVFEQLDVDGERCSWQRRRGEEGIVSAAAKREKSESDDSDRDAAWCDRDGDAFFCKRIGREEEGGDRREGKGGTGIGKKEKKQSLNLAWSRNLSITVFYRRRPASRTAVPRRSQNA